MNTLPPLPTRPMTRLLPLAPLPLLLLVACPGGDKETGDTADTQDTQDTTETDTSESDTAETDTGETDTEETDTAQERMGLAGRLGTHTADASSWEGTEELYFIGDEGEGADICRLQLSFSSDSPNALLRDDCDVYLGACDFAWDLEIVAAEIVAESDVGCAGTWGTPESWVGQVVSYAYVSEYYGHAQVIMVDEGKGWDAVSFAFYDDEAKLLTYDWEDGERPY